MITYSPVSAINESIQQVKSDSVQAPPYPTGICGVFN